MNNKEFFEYTNEIENFYGKKLTETERDIWYENLKFMSVERFNYIISELYKTNEFMPKLAEILAIHKSLPYQEEHVEQKEHCSKCNGTGYVTYIKVENGIPYQHGAICECNRQARYDGRQSTDLRNKSNYYIPTMAEIGLKVENAKPTKEQLLKSMQILKNSPIIPESVKEIIRRKYATMR